MQGFKIDHFLKTNPGRLFPAFETLQPSEARSLKRKWAKAMGLPVEARPLTILKAMRAASLLIIGNPEDPSFDLLAALSTFGVTRGQNVLLNWDRFEEVDRMKVGALVDNFSDVWYPSSDDLEILMRRVHGP